MKLNFKNKKGNLLIKWSFIIICTFIAVTTSAQQQTVWEWARSNGGSEWDIVNTVSYSSKGYIYTGGSFKQKAKFGKKSLNSEGFRDLFINCYTSKGEVKWTIQGGGKGDDWVSKVISLPNGDLAFAGKYASKATLGKLTLKGSDFNIFTGVADATGNIKWVHSVNADETSEVQSLATDSLGNLFVGGTCQDKLSFDKQEFPALGGTDIFLLKYEPDGKINWAKRFGGKGFDNLNGICIKDSSLYIGFEYTANMLLDQFSLNVYEAKKKNIALARINLNGKVLQVRNAGYGDIELKGIKNLYNRLYLYGTVGLNSVIHGNTDDNKGGMDMFMAYYTDSLSLVKSKLIGGKGRETLWDITSGLDSSFIISGGFDMPFSQDELEVTPANENSVELLVLGLDKKWNLKWYNQLGSKGEDYPRAMINDNEGHTYICGSFTDTLVYRDKKLKGMGREDVILARLYQCDASKLRIRGDSILCKGSLGKLQPDKIYSEYQWNNQAFSERTLTISDSGLYRLRVVDSLGCAYHDSVKVRFVRIPHIELGPDRKINNTQTIQFEVAQGYRYYEWNQMRGQNRYVFDGKKYTDGVYPLEIAVADSNSCVGKDTVYITVEVIRFTDAEKLLTAKIKIFPNPTREKAGWTIEDADLKEIDAKITDPSGHILWSENYAGIVRNTLHEVDLSKFKPGIYYLRLSSGNISRTETIILTK